MSRPKLRLQPHWKPGMHMNFDDHYEMHYHDQKLGIVACRWTERISECEVGKSKMYFQIIGQKRTYRSQEALMRALAKKSEKEGAEG